MLGQPITMLIPKVVGFRLTGELPDGATATDLVLTITEMLRKHGVVGKFVEFYGDGRGRGPGGQPGHDRQHEPGVRLHLRDLPDRRGDLTTCGSPAARRSRSRWSRRTPRSRACGTTRRATPATPRSSASTCPPWCPSLAGPKRPQDRVALADAKRRSATRCRDYVTELDRLDNGSPAPSRPPTRAAANARRQPAPRARSRSRLEDGTTTARRPRLRRHRRHHVLHQHVQPVRHGRRRPAGQERGRARAWPASPGSRPRWRPAPRWSWTTTSGPGCCPTWTSSASTWSATAAPPASATPARCPPAISEAVQRQRPGRGRRAVRQPELRGPDQPRREDELPGLPAAGRRLRAGRHHGHRPAPRAARLRRRRQAGLPRATSGPRRRRSPTWCSDAVAAEMFTRDYADVFEGDDHWRALRRSRRATPSPGTRTSTYVRRPPYFDGHARRARAGHRHRGREGAGQAGRLGDHRPHLAGRRDQDRQPGRDVPDRARRRAQGLQLLRLPARQPRGDDPRHVRQHPAAQPARAGHRGRRDGPRTASRCPSTTRPASTSAKAPR